MLDNTIIPSSRISPIDNNKHLFSISIVITLIFSIIVHVLLFQRYTPIPTIQKTAQSIQAPIQFYLSHETLILGQQQPKPIVKKDKKGQPSLSAPLPNKATMTSAKKIIPLIPSTQTVVIEAVEKKQILPQKTTKIRKNKPALSHKVVKETKRIKSHQPKNKKTKQTPKVKHNSVKLPQTEIAKTSDLKNTNKKIQDLSSLHPIPKQTTNLTTNDSPATSPKSQQVNQYKKSILKLIENNKYYPKIARRRGIQGKVKVSFKLLNNGDIKDLIIIHKKSILVKATQKAIDNSLPLPTPSQQLTSPIAFSFYMAYSLK